MDLQLSHSTGSGLLFLLLFTCTLSVVHRQFSFEYPLLLSILSNFIPSGLGPISLKNVLKSNHSLDTVIPRQPYSLQSLFLGFVQRCFMCIHILYSGLYRSPCVVFRRMMASMFQHPHDRVFPFTNWSLNTQFFSPQSHLHSHFIRRLPSFLGTNFQSLVTTNFPNLIPDMSFIGRSCISSLAVGQVISLQTTLEEKICRPH